MNGRCRCRARECMGPACVWWGNNAAEALARVAQPHWRPPGATMGSKPPLPTGPQEIVAPGGAGRPRLPGVRRRTDRQLPLAPPPPPEEGPRIRMGAVLSAVDQLIERRRLSRVG